MKKDSRKVYRKSQVQQFFLMPMFLCSPSSTNLSFKKVVLQGENLQILFPDHFFEQHVTSQCMGPDIIKITSILLFFRFSVKSPRLRRDQKKILIFRRGQKARDLFEKGGSSRENREFTPLQRFETLIYCNTGYLIQSTAVPLSAFLPRVSELS